MAETNRRDFIKNAGIVGAASGIGLTVGAGCAAPQPQTPPTQAVHPFGYPERGLDVEETRRLAYEAFKGRTLPDGTSHGGCGFGTFHAIISQLAEVVGAPYTTVPTQMMDWAGAGVVGFGTLCGTLNAAAAAIGIICDRQDARGFISDLLTWYSETPLPSNRLAPDEEFPKSQADSNLCHVSITRWCLASGLASGSPERIERCARVSGDVAAKAVELLNDGALGLQVPAQKTTCRTCHYMGTNFDVGHYTHGEMNCLTCHINLKEKDVVPTGH